MALKKGIWVQHKCGHLRKYHDNRFLEQAVVDLYKTCNCGMCAAKNLDEKKYN